jgi:hypothetical protein
MVLQHLLRRPSIFKASLGSLAENDYFEDDAELSWVYKCAVAYYENFNEPPTEGSLLVELDGPEHTQMRGYIKEWFSLPDTYSWSDKLVKDEILEFVAGSRLTAMREAMDEGDIGNRHDMREVLADSLGVITTDMFGDTPDLNPFTDIKAHMETAVRHPTGVDFIDNILDGGVRPGEVLGFVIPTSGGKTTLGLQLADAQVMQARHVAVLSSEQRLKGDISVRCFTLGARTHQNAFKEGYDQAEPEIREALDLVSPAWLKYFHFFDQTSLNVDNIASAFAPIYKLKSQGETPYIVVIDWWGRLKDRIMGAQQKHLSDAQERKLSRSLLQDVKDVSEDLGVTTIVLHQMAGAVAERGHKHKPSSHSAQEDKNFNNMMDFCFTISKKDPANGRVTLRADKARSTANNEVKLVLDGGHCLFRMTDGPDNYVEDLATMPEYEENGMGANVLYNRTDD